MATDPHALAECPREGQEFLTFDRIRWVVNAAHKIHDDVGKGMDQALDRHDADTIKSHYQVLHSGIERSKKTSSREAQARDWGLNMVKDMMHKVDDSKYD
jgi:hypothetical protein